MSSPEFINLEVSLHSFSLGHMQSQVCSDNFADNVKGKRDHSKDFTQYLLKTSHCFGCALEPALRAANCLRGQATAPLPGGGH